MTDAPAMPGRMPGRMPQRCPDALHATYATQLTGRIQDQEENPHVPNAAGPVESGGFEYVETPADHSFTAFLAGLTPGRVLRDRERTFSKEERKRQRFLRAKARLEALDGARTKETAA